MVYKYDSNNNATSAITAMAFANEVDLSYVKCSAIALNLKVFYFCIYFVLLWLSISLISFLYT